MTPGAAPATLPVGPWELAAASSLVAVAGLASLAFRLGLGPKLAVASVRAVVQLLAVGHVLRLVFEASGPLAVGVMLLAMTAFAARAAVGRVERPYAGAAWDAWLVLALSGLAVSWAVAVPVLGVTPWWTPRYVIPLAGMVFGNVLTGVSLALDTLLEALHRERGAIEADLAVGATWWEAARDPLRRAIGRGMVPILNSMTVVGLVSLPGMMTGQLLAGSSPMQAVGYQIVILFALAAATALGTVGVATLGARRLFDDAHRLRLERLPPLRRPARARPGPLTRLRRGWSSRGAGAGPTSGATPP